MQNKTFWELTTELICENEFVSALMLNLRIHVNCLFGSFGFSHAERIKYDCLFMDTSVVRRMILLLYGMCHNVLRSEKHTSKKLILFGNL